MIESITYAKRLKVAVAIVVVPVRECPIKGVLVHVVDASLLSRPNVEARICIAKA